MLKKSVKYTVILFFERKQKKMIEELIEIIAKQLSVDASEITPDTDILDDIGADSLAVVDILMTIEDRFGVVVPDDEAPNLRTVRLMSEYLEANM